MPRTRGTTRQRGYSGQHPRLRKQWQPAVDAGMVICHAVICLEERDGRTRWIQPGTPWHLGHNPERTAWTGPEHQRCNIADANRRKSKAASHQDNGGLHQGWSAPTRPWFTSRRW